MGSTTLSFKMPENACNAHLHIIDPAFPNDGKAAVQHGTVNEYRAVAAPLGLKRAVFVQAKPFGLDNSCLIDAIKRFGMEDARGIAVTNASVSDAELEYMNEAGIKGLRFSLWNPHNAVVSFEDCFPLSERIRQFGWNIQLHMGASQMAEHADVIRNIKCRIVIDHMGRPDPSLGVKDPAFAFVLEMIDRGNTWVKLSGPYLNTAPGRTWKDCADVAHALAEFAPERVVWGSDFPHVTEKIKPNEAVLTEMIAEWLPSEEARRLALVSNPEELYGFRA